jgi:hypothetical protein
MLDINGGKAKEDCDEVMTGFNLKAINVDM